MTSHPNVPHRPRHKEQVFDAEKHLGTPKAQIIRKLASGGHIGLFMGKKTLTECWPEVARWIRSA